MLNNIQSIMVKAMAEGMTMRVDWPDHINKQNGHVYQEQDEHDENGKVYIYENTRGVCDPACPTGQEEWLLNDFLKEATLTLKHVNG